MFSVFKNLFTYTAVFWKSVKTFQIIISIVIVAVLAGSAMYFRVKAEWEVDCGGSVDLPQNSAHAITENVDIDLPDSIKDHIRKMGAGWALRELDGETSLKRILAILCPLESDARRMEPGKISAALNILVLFPASDDIKNTLLTFLENDDNQSLIFYGWYLNAFYDLGFGGEAIGLVDDFINNPAVNPRAKVAFLYSAISSPHGERMNFCFPKKLLVDCFYLVSDTGAFDVASKVFMELANNKMTLKDETGQYGAKDILEAALKRNVEILDALRGLGWITNNRVIARNIPSGENIPSRYGREESSKRDIPVPEANEGLVEIVVGPLDLTQPEQMDRYLKALALLSPSVEARNALLEKMEAGISDDDLYAATIRALVRINCGGEAEAWIQKGYSIPGKHTTREKLDFLANVLHDMDEDERNGMSGVILPLSPKVLVEGLFLDSYVTPPKTSTLKLLNWILKDKYSVFTFVDTPITAREILEMAISHIGKLELEMNRGQGLLAEIAPPSQPATPGTPKVLDLLSAYKTLYIHYFMIMNDRPETVAEYENTGKPVAIKGPSTFKGLAKLLDESFYPGPWSSEEGREYVQSVLTPDLVAFIQAAAAGAPHEGYLFLLPPGESLAISGRHADKSPNDWFSNYELIATPQRYGDNSPLSYFISSHQEGVKGKDMGRATPDWSFFENERPLSPDGGWREVSPDRPPAQSDEEVEMEEGEYRFKVLYGQRSERIKFSPSEELALGTILDGDFAVVASDTGRTREGYTYFIPPKGERFLTNANNGDEPRTEIYAIPADYPTSGKYAFYAARSASRIYLHVKEIGGRINSWHDLTPPGSSLEAANWGKIVF